MSLKNVARKVMALRIPGPELVFGWNLGYEVHRIIFPRI